MTVDVVLRSVAFMRRIQAIPAVNVVLKELGHF